ncbi:mannitol dehydrogenase family protein [Saccharibacillus sp. JS10]|uniref:mannitol dehydrogenase family protein n=1 Tax=Saccharibacillus sp. JS10 TaxID=2950552 RepID=UPI00210DE9BA|nr:mannitol dehydrogenase family protein [Saccharibacillus sp. JS10]MCQ4088061.1 mannitol dehydrogenase family protein [Saccharibacillus sp. JS10]
MLELNERGLQHVRAWEAAGVELPQYDRKQITENTRNRPRWIHFGAGNIFRSLIAKAAQNLLNQGAADTGIIIAATPGSETLNQIYRPHDLLTLAVEMSADGTFHKKLLASVTHALYADPTLPEDYAQLTAAFENESLQLVSFTITEKGYSLTNADGEYNEQARRDFEADPAQATHVIAVVAALALYRYRKGSLPLAFVSLDNCSRNGDVLRASLTTVAKQWIERGYAESGFLHYLEDSNLVSFPLTMVDKITPRPSEIVQAELERLGIEGMNTSTSSRHTYSAPFVNAEQVEYVVIEDHFPAGRPDFEAAGFYMSNRETVIRTETMKVTTCLNPIHTALAITGCLLGYKKISDEMRDPLLRQLAENIGRHEGLPVVVDPGILSPATFLGEVLQERFPNPYIPDTPQRIAADTSQKIGIRFGHTLRAYMEHPNLNAADLVSIPLVIAAWCRYLQGIGDDGQPFEISPDPRLDELRQRLEQPEAIRGILSDTSLFGVDLQAAGLIEKIERMYKEMSEGVGAVRRTLERELNAERSV